MISIRHLHKQFGKQIVLDDVNLEIEQGTSMAIVGPSGTGKSVLLRIITGLMPADAGEVLVHGESMTGVRNETERQKIALRMGVLFQGAALFDSMNLLDNVAFPLRERHELSEKQIIERSLRRLDEVGLHGMELAMPGEVSIGMRKRVGIARALVSDPEILLFDEPNTGLDPQMGQEIYELIIETQRISGFTGIVVSHEIPEIFQVCKRVAMLYQGKVQIDGSVSEFLNSENSVVQQFVRGDTAGPIVLS